LRIREKIIGTCAVMVGALTISLPGPADAAGAATSATTLYRQAMATTIAWSVHYVSAGTIAKSSILSSGDAGPASGTQEVLISQGSESDSASLIVIGGITYMKGNAQALTNLAGLSGLQATADAGKWVQFATDSQAYSQIVAGVRSRDVAQELALKGPYALGAPRLLNGYRVVTITGTQKFSGQKAMHTVLYVRAYGRHVPVEEDSVNAKGKPDGVEHTVFSKWGEAVRPQAPAITDTIGPVSAT
jgi:hypothetical protein